MVYAHASVLENETHKILWDFEISINGPGYKKVDEMHKALDPRDDIDRLYVLRKEGRSGLASINDNVNVPIRRLEDSIKKLRTWRIVHFAVPGDHMVKLKKIPKKDKYEELVQELKDL